MKFKIGQRVKYKDYDGYSVEGEIVSIIEEEDNILKYEVDDDESFFSSYVREDKIINRSEKLDLI